MQSYGKEISQFYCELAQEALQAKQPDQARTELGPALKANSGNVRATILLGEVEQAADNHTAALAYWQRVEQQNPQYLPLVAERIMQKLSSDRARGRWR